MYYAMRASAPSLHRESTDSLIHKIIALKCSLTSFALEKIPQNSGEHSESLI